LLLLLVQLSEGFCRQYSAVTVSATAVRGMLQAVQCCYCWCYSCQRDVAGSKVLLLLVLQLSEGFCRQYTAVTVTATAVRGMLRFLPINPLNHAFM